MVILAVLFTTIVISGIIHRDGDDIELSLGSASEELSVTDDSKSDSKPDINTTISPPPKRRNSYRLVINIRYLGID